MRNRVNHTARPRKGHPYAFKDYDDDGIIHQSMVSFLESLWKRAASDSCFFLATTGPDGEKWREHVVHGDNITVGLNRFFREHSRWDYNLYFWKRFKGLDDADFVNQLKGSLRSDVSLHLAHSSLAQTTVFSTITNERFLGQYSTCVLYFEFTCD